MESMRTDMVRLLRYEVSKSRADPLAVVRRESRQKDAMINGVKCSGKVKKNKCGNLLLVNGKKQVILNAKRAVSIEWNLR